MAVSEHYKIVEIHDVVVDTKWGSHQYRIEIIQNMSGEKRFHYRVYICLTLEGCNIVNNGYPKMFFREISVWVRFYQFPESHYGRHTPEEALQDALCICKTNDLTITIPGEK